jgi:hypothetical protein
MFRRFSAGTVLALLCCWSVPVARASVLPADDLAQKPGSGRDNHSCCPSYSRFASSVFVTLARSKMPCRDQHPCCARQVPDSPPLLSAISRMPRPDSGGLLLALTVVSWAQTATQTTRSTPPQSSAPAEKAKCACCDKMAAADTKDAHASCADHMKHMKHAGDG